jgi:hypothetical protein
MTASRCTQHDQPLLQVLRYAVAAAIIVGEMQPWQPRKTITRGAILGNGRPPDSVSK